LDYFSTECIYSPEAFRGSARTLIKALEKVRPSAILDIVRSGEAFSRMILSQAQASGARPPQESGVDADSGSGDAGCSNGGAGRSSGGEMGDMEKALIAEMSGLEASIILTPSISPGKLKKTKQTPKKIREQKMSNCTRCGYLTSQKLCKACTLLEGLNKNRPKTVVEVETGIGNEGSTTSLRRGIEAIKLEEGIAN